MVVKTRFCIVCGDVRPRQRRRHRAEQLLKPASNAVGAGYMTRFMSISHQLLTHVC